MTLAPLHKDSTTEVLNRHSAEQGAAVGKGLFSILRELERRAGHKPRIGKNTRLRDAVVQLGQDPSLTFPTRDLARVDLNHSTPRLRAQFMGLFGAFGALPLNWSEEVEGWFSQGDEAFVAFADIFVARFQELFFRSWSDAQAISQFDHAEGDRFQAYILSLLGLGTPAVRHRDGLGDLAKVRLAPLAIGRVKSPVRLQQMLALHFGTKATFEIEEHVPSWLALEPDATNAVGQRASTLGQNLFLGAQVQSLGAKIRVHIRLPDIDRYDAFLPGGCDHTHLRDIIFWYLGQAFEVEIALWLPRYDIRPAVLGETAHLGWMACIAPDPDVLDPQVRVTRYPLDADPTLNPQFEPKVA